MKTTCAVLILISSVVCSWAEPIGESSIPTGPSHSVSGSSLTTTVSSGLTGPISLAEDEGWPQPTVYQLNPEYVEAMHLTKEQERALSAYMPGFKQWTLTDYPAAIKYYSYAKNSLPYIVKGDFDGNGKADLVVACHVGDENILLAIMDASTGYSVLPILTYTKKPNLDVVYILEKGTIFSLDNDYDEGKEEALSQDAIQLAQIGSNAVSFGGRSVAHTLLRYKEELEEVHPIIISSRTPSTYKSEYSKMLALPPAMEKFLYAYDKDFKIWTLQDYPAYFTTTYPNSAKSLPYVVKGDFNGDGIDDTVVAGHNKDGNRIVTLLSDATGYSVRGGGDDCYLETRKLGKQISYMPSYMLGIQDAGLKVNFEKRSDLTLTLCTDSYSFQAIASCSTISNEAIKNGGIGVVYGDWHKVEEAPRFSGFVKSFYRSDGLPLRLIRPPSAQKAGN